MILLAIDTSGSGCYVAIYDSDADRTLGIGGEEIGRGHAERLMDFTDQALANAGVDLLQIERIAVTIGPGSFTGIRVGVAATRGLSLALGIPSVGITTLAVLASQHLRDHPGAPVFVAMDAKRGEAYCQAFSSDGLPASEAAVLSLDDAKAAAALAGGTVVGSAAPLLSGGEPASLVDGLSIEVVARLGALADPAADRPKPLYLRGPDAKPQAGFAIARA
ncbi:tRNA (adenosine(37)-N6)-threonylcarbamoyltransferase complex dimerization subunit type 1 TsaB [Rhizobium sp. ARZ01]|uniref:tRNA (adenosine(37)-N6)-threonylcarbamoyltransferase complex dimerization subunit type 1 TsaB n=1 Tax=Rhizobium sp. ARZ01 TaxID=2769313 RepID=UPI00177D94F9|nr:tRNA (adenosine(37)-N6)-threonylcarbamoyltransferase complex dimerization subunit type 1 TsaB [Rhizobium sp. ARZ01]MBD9374051.1 tRNA (adenosine(37)-N6)-threonylcarbamoyltransferase complex dimerization subunit type 1 TsaB [Rhizobium sp. ARZ01]